MTVKKKITGRQFRDAALKALNKHCPGPRGEGNTYDAKFLKVYRTRGAQLDMMLYDELDIKSQGAVGMNDQATLAIVASEEDISFTKNDISIYCRRYSAERGNYGHLFMKFEQIIPKYKTATVGDLKNYVYYVWKKIQKSQQR
eukprot:UN25735